jgi:hypothetical protein
MRRLCLHLTKKTKPSKNFFSYRGNEKIVDTIGDMISSNDECDMKIYLKIDTGVSAGLVK